MHSFNRKSLKCSCLIGIAYAIFTSLMRMKRIMFIFTHHHYEYVGIYGVEAAPLGTGEMHMIMFSNYAEYKSAF